MKVIQTDWPAPDRLVEDEVFVASGLPIEFEMCQLAGQDELLARCADADALIVAYVPLPRRVLQGLPLCRSVSFMATGFNSIDLAAATELGIVVTNVAGYCTGEVADHTLAFLLSLSRNLSPLHRSVLDGAWDYKSCPRPERLSLQTLGIIGLGRIGTQVARRAAAFGMRVLACDPYVDDEHMAGAGAKRASLEKVLAADFVSVHCSLTGETHHMIDAAALAKMKPTAYLINTSRGGCVDTDALAAALGAGALSGAAVDVLDPEPAPRGHPIYSLPNALITPHAAFYSRSAEEDGRRWCCEQVVSVLRGEVPRFICNPEVLTSPRLRLRPPPSPARGAKT